MTRTAFAFSIAASTSAPCDSAERALGASAHLDDERDPVALGDRLAQLAHERDRNRPASQTRSHRHVVLLSRCALCSPSSSSVLVGAAPPSARGDGHAGQRPARRERRARTSCEGSPGTTGSLARAGDDFLQGGPGRDAHDAGAGHDLVAASYDGARDVVRCGTGPRRRQRRPHRRGRRRLRARRTAALARSLHDGGRAARDRGRAGQLHGRSYDRRHVPGRTTFRRRGDERRLRGVDGRRRPWRSGLLPGLTVASVPSGAERAGERPGRRLRRGARDLADLDARARGRDDPTRDQPLDRRDHLEHRRSTRTRSAVARGHRLRQELGRLRQHAVVTASTVAATSCTRTRPTATCSR